MGRDVRNENRKEPVTAMRLSVMQSPAWRALSPTAQCLYVWVKLEWRGKNFNNNGQLRLSVRQAAERIGCSTNTAMRGFQDLQRKGFIIQTEGASLGTEGMGKAPAYELTEMPAEGVKGPGKQLYLNWNPGHDFPVRTIANRTRSKTKPRRNFEDTSVVVLETKRC